MPGILVGVNRSWGETTFTILEASLARQVFRIVGTTPNEGATLYAKWWWLILSSLSYVKSTQCSATSAMSDFYPSTPGRLLTQAARLITLRDSTLQVDISRRDGSLFNAGAEAVVLIYDKDRASRIGIRAFIIDIDKIEHRRFSEGPQAALPDILRISTDEERDYSSTASPTAPTQPPTLVPPGYWDASLAEVHHDEDSVQIAYRQIFVRPPEVGLETEGEIDLDEVSTLNEDMEDAINQDCLQEASNDSARVL